MKHPLTRRLSGFTHVLLLALSGYAAFAEIKYRLSRQPWHVALSNQTVHVDFKGLANASVQNLTVSLIDVNRNQIIATKLIPGNQSQSSVEFECFHFNYAGNFEFRVTDFTSNGTAQWTTDLLQVKWPVFHIDVGRKTASQSNFQIKVFTHEYLCPWKVNTLTLFLDVTRIDLNEPGTYNADKVVRKTINKEIDLSNSQWVIFDCTDFSQDAFITISLRSPCTNSVISSKGPLVFAQIVGYKLLVDHLRTAACESSAEVGIVTPPCARAPGKISVYKIRKGASFTRDSFVAEKWLRPRENKTEFNCSVFDTGKNNYCFEYVNILNNSHTPTKAVNCVTLQRHAEQKSGDPGKVHNQAYKTGNIVTITGISLCLVIIIATIAITIRTKLSHKTQNCNSAVRQGSVPQHNFRKSLEVERNFSDLSPQRDFLTDNVPPFQLEDGMNIPLNFRRSQHFIPNQDSRAEENLGPQSAQKVIPPIFGYRLAHQQLKEMKKKGITEATQVYHVTQHPLDDTVINEGELPTTDVDQTNSSTVTAPSLDKENNEESNMNRFRIKSPFLDQKSIYYKQQTEKANHRMDFMIAPFPEPFSDFSLQCQMPPQVSSTVPICEGSNKTLPIRPGKFRHCEKLTEIEMHERGYGRNPNFRRTSSFNECKTIKFYRERSMSSCTRKLPSLPHSRAICRAATVTDRSIGDKIAAQSRFNIASSAKHHAQNCSAFTAETSKYRMKSSQTGARTCKAELASDQQMTNGVINNLETYTGKRGSSTPTNRYKLTAKVSDPDSKNYSNWRYPRSNPLPRHQYRQDRCQSFPSDPNFLLYDNSGFELTASEQQIIDLPAHLSSCVYEDEEDTSTLSNEKLVI
ncbi:thrombospondin type-1 domain-containing protein 1 isoform X2 [Heterodontus francisci]|uniref:thrombospondin type-1 domain-containing protein 1 isoform X2 n=1 Tax=Heterodontus francisci TaxID=7792 RepID=UPI00355C0BD4